MQQLLSDYMCIRWSVVHLPRYHDDVSQPGARLHASRQALSAGHMLGLSFSMGCQQQNHWQVHGDNRNMHRKPVAVFVLCCWVVLAGLQLSPRLGFGPRSGSSAAACVVPRCPATHQYHSPPQPYDCKNQPPMQLHSSTTAAQGQKADTLC